MRCLLASIVSRLWCRSRVRFEELSLCYELRVGTKKFLALATHGEVRQSGMMNSDLLPHTASIAD